MAKRKDDDELTEKDLESKEDAPGDRKVDVEPDLRKVRIKCKVHHANMAPENRNLPITVNDCGVQNGKKQFMPGETVDLTGAQVAILEDSVEYHEIKVDGASGIYSSANPIESARAHYPGYHVEWSPGRNEILVRKMVSNYIIERKY